MGPLNCFLETKSILNFFDKSIRRTMQYNDFFLYFSFRHTQSHTDLPAAKLFCCQQCPFKTKIKGHLKRHMNQHTGDKPYPCPHCSFHSTSWENLRKHILKTDKHKGKYVFECKKCKEAIPAKTTSDETAEKEIFKTNSHQEYQKHLKKAHS